MTAIAGAGIIASGWLGRWHRMARRFLSLVIAAALLAGCAMQPSAQLPPASGEAPAHGPSEEAMVAGGLATGAVIALIAVAAVAGTATLVFVSDP